ncbi:MAG: MarR family winged helix-turn-helix transcriptional regulator [Alphaproteobacteria bacterium]
MADVKPGVNPLFLRDEELRQGMELLFFAFRDVASRGDAMLAAEGLGRAHQRVIYFVGRHPLISVGALLDILGITKQSLSRVLKHLVHEGYVEYRPGPKDRRQRLLTLSAKGAELETKLTALQRGLFASAYRAAGAEAVEGFRKVLEGLCKVSAPAARSSLAAPEVKR